MSSAPVRLVRLGAGQGARCSRCFHSDIPQQLRRGNLQTLNLALVSRLNLRFDGPMPETIYDAVIIGGGPAGSSAATFLALAGKRVLVLEKERFPRFHIGESLLPYNRRLFADMGVLETLEREGFPLKTGAQFHVGNGSKCLKLIFPTVPDRRH